MAEPFLSEIRIFSFNFPPKGWAFCNGQFLQINQNQALFSLLGTTYGGNGQTTFALPNLRGRTPIHVGNGHTLGEAAGQEAVTLTIANLPQHTHVLNGTSTNSTAVAPVGSNVLGRAASATYAPAPPTGALNAATIGNTGGSQPHENRQPFLTLSFGIALQGIFPSQT